MLCFLYRQVDVCPEMGNTESVVVQKRLARFRPDERPVVEGVFERLQTGSAGETGKSGKALTVDMLKVRITG